MFDLRKEIQDSIDAYYPDEYIEFMRGVFKVNDNKIVTVAITDMSIGAVQLNQFDIEDLNYQTSGLFVRLDKPLNIGLWELQNVTELTWDMNTQILSTNKEIYRVIDDNLAYFLADFRATNNFSKEYALNTFMFSFVDWVAQTNPNIAKTY